MRRSRRQPLVRALLTAGTFLGTGLLAGALFPTAGVHPAAAQQPRPAPQAPASQAPAPAQGGGQQAPTTVPGESFGDWQTRCTERNERGARTCEMFQDVTLKDSGQRVMHLAVGFRPGENSARAVFVLPLGFSLPGGVTIGIDGRQPGKYQVEYCDPGGCRVDVDLAAGLLGAMRAGQQGEVTIRHRSGQELNIPFSLSGFTAAYNSLR